MSNLFLNMIVRDEAAIIDRCLQSVLPWISGYAICDTGSKDDTVEKIKACVGHLPGGVLPIPFEDFSQARNAALEWGHKLTVPEEYLLLIDADMTLQGHEELKHLTAPGYLLEQRNGQLNYLNLRIIQSHRPERYWGKTHECIAVPGQATLRQAYLLDHSDGGTRGEKFTRDVRLLTEEIAADPNNARAHFYLANTYHDVGRYDEALPLYKTRVKLGGWDEEVWFAKYRIALCYLGLKDEPNFVTACLAAHEARPTRAEPLKALVRYYRMKGYNHVAYGLAKMGKRIRPTNDGLFVDPSAWDWRSEISITGWYCGHPHNAKEACMSLCIDPKIRGSATQAEARKNWHWYATALHGDVMPIAPLPPSVDDPPLYRATNPSICWHTGRDGKKSLLCNVRYTNYTMTPEGQFPSRSADGKIRTKNLLVDLCPYTFRVLRYVWLEEPSRRVVESRILGLEDVRLVSWDNRLFACATVSDMRTDERREMAVLEIDPETGKGLWLGRQEYEAEKCQKNWAPTTSVEGLCFVYSYDPLVVLRFNPAIGQCRKLAGDRHSTLAVDDQRGSSQAISWGDGYLALTHDVAYHKGKRRYLHKFLHMDKDWQVIEATQGFFFREGAGVEFCCGMTQFGADVLISFSQEDGPPDDFKTAYLMRVSSAHIRALLQGGYL